MLVLFDDPSKNLQAITPWAVEFRLLRPGPPPRVAFASPVTDLLDDLDGEVRVVAPPPALSAFAAWTAVLFNHGCDLNGRRARCMRPAGRGEGGRDLLEPVLRGETGRPAAGGGLIRAKGLEALRQNNQNVPEPPPE
jgi:hypothetical protein